MNDRETYMDMTNTDKSAIVARMLNNLPNYILRNLVVKNFNNMVVDEDKDLRHRQGVEIYAKIATEFIHTTFGDGAYGFNAYKDESEVLDRIENILLGMDVMHVSLRGNTIELYLGYDIIETTKCKSVEDMRIYVNGLSNRFSYDVLYVCNNLAQKIAPTYVFRRYGMGNVVFD